MDELIKVTVKEDRQLVSARDLHKGLEVKTRFSQWVTQNFKVFIEGSDFTSVVGTTVVNNGAKREIQDYAMTVDMAKQVSLMSQTPQGKFYREYFISLEAKWNDPQEVVKRGYAILQNENAQLRIENTELKPKADYTDKMLANPGLETTSVIAKNYGYSTREFNKLLHGLGIQYKQGKTWLLYSKYQNQGYTHVEPFPYKDSKGLEQVRNTMKWTQKGQRFLYDFLESKGIMPKVEQTA
ncbi:phage antirepressor KilAC domain-containing protein [Levilactobacillus brevis]|uniref:phage antirepressor KilAC domain-containing protein n=1 Tax=Levilactobacillus brevis TaxID=1580 RepID=UPI001C10C3B3|nr:phage antirepressor KilAC domain-containing protein [Levilactobacillus brevis]MBU5275353.1 phage antirepressor KilAC domain-containing protein [Levilactobacillus brevis]